MNEIHCLVVDDEPLARDIIHTYISRIPGWKLAHSCMNAVEAYEQVSRGGIDVLFLDIQMPMLSGIDFLRSLKHPPLVVFTTAYTNYAVTGFELNAVDYLVKPVTFERFCQAVEKLNARMQGSAIREVQPLPQADYFFIKQDTRLVKICYSDLLFMEAQKDYTFIHLKNKKMIAGMHLKALEELLVPSYILRIHRSYIVNLNAIRSINGNTVEIEGKEIPIGPYYKDALFRSLGL